MLAIKALTSQLERDISRFSYYIKFIMKRSHCPLRNPNYEELK